MSKSDSGTARFRFSSATMGRVKSTPAKASPKAVNSEPTAEDNNDLKAVLEDLSVAEVIELVEAGEADLADVIEAERAGKGRKTILALIQSDSGKVYAKQV